MQFQDLGLLEVVSPTSHRGEVPEVELVVEKPWRSRNEKWPTSMFCWTQPWEIPGFFGRCIVESTSTFLYYWRVDLFAGKCGNVLDSRTEPGFVDATILLKKHMVSCIQRAFFKRVLFESQNGVFWASQKPSIEKAPHGSDRTVWLWEKGAMFPSFTCFATNLENYMEAAVVFWGICFRIFTKLEQFVTCCVCVCVLKASVLPPVEWS